MNGPVQCAYCVEPAVALIAGVPGTPGAPYREVPVCLKHGRSRLRTLAEVKGGPE